jgi:ATP-dependent protease ClpP protease subunit
MLEGLVFKRRMPIDLAEFIHYAAAAVYLLDDLNNLSAEEIDQFVELHVPEITLYITSPGGDVIDGLAIIRAIQRAQRAGIKVIGVVRGEACSMAFVVLQVCDERVMSHGDALMAHGVVGAMNGDSRTIEASVRLLDHWREYLAGLCAEKVRRTKPESPACEAAFWVPIFKSDVPNYYLADEALDRGYVDIVRD